jgi:hypothetical protein
VDLTFTQSSASEDLDIHLYNVNSVDLTPCSPADPLSCDTANGQSTTANEAGIYQAPASGCAPCTYFVVVEGYDGGENSYEIRIEGS